MTKKRIVYTGPFDPTLCDGVSSAMHDLLVFLNQQGHEVFIISFMHENNATREFLDREIDSLQVDILAKDNNKTNFLLNGINVMYEVLPYTREQVLRGNTPAIKYYAAAINTFKDSFFFTVDEDLSCFAAHILAETSPAHFIHSPHNTINTFSSSPQLARILRKRTVFTVSTFFRNKLKQELNVDALVWEPFIDSNRFNIGNEQHKPGRIGYYSAGPHKGDGIVHQLIQRMPEHYFVIMGEHCSISLKRENTTYLGKVTTIKDFYKEISVVLVPSTIPEGYSRIIIEAALNGIPTIANNTGGTPEALGNSGILLEIEPCAKSMAIKYEAAINKILNEYPAYKKKALARASDYSKDIQNKSLRYAEIIIQNQQHKLSSQ
jgi:glycosyltransferase involved in cell wall biosynthesis